MKLNPKYIFKAKHETHPNSEAKIPEDLCKELKARYPKEIQELKDLPKLFDPSEDLTEDEFTV